MMKFLERHRNPDSMKGFYNWFYRFYRLIERSLEPAMDEVLESLFSRRQDITGYSAIEYACGSGSLSIRLAKYFQSVNGRDISAGMLSRAKIRSGEKGLNLFFKEGDILAIDEGDASFDFVFVSFALHLFPETDIRNILKKLICIARKEIIVIDHRRAWSPAIAFVEWLEGSYYRKFIGLDICGIVLTEGAQACEESEISDCSVFRIIK